MHTLHLSQFARSTTRADISSSMLPAFQCFFLTERFRAKMTCGKTLSACATRNLLKPRNIGKHGNLQRWATSATRRQPADVAARLNFLRLNFTYGSSAPFLMCRRATDAFRPFGSQRRPPPNPPPPRPPAPPPHRPPPDRARKAAARWKEAGSWGLATRDTPRKCRGVVKSCSGSGSRICTASWFQELFTRIASLFSSRACDAAELEAIGGKGRWLTRLSTCPQIGNRWGS